MIINWDELIERKALGEVGNRTKGERQGQKEKLGERTLFIACASLR